MEWGLLPNTVALASVALLGYMFGRSALRRPHADPNQMRREFQRAREVVSELERISMQMRRHLATHHGSIAQIHQRLVSLQSEAVDEPAKAFCRDAQQLLMPTKQMAQDMTHAYEALRKQSSKLTTFNDVRIDSLTNLSSRKAIDESMAMLLAMKKRYHNPFAAALITIDGFADIQREQGEAASEAAIRQVADILQANVRETDIAGRFGGGEFVVLMPETDLKFAAVVTRRIRRIVQRDTDLTVSSGLTAAGQGDTARSLMHRAEMALNDAHAHGRNSISQHDGDYVDEVATTPFLVLDEAEQTLPMTVPVTETALV